MRLKLNRGEDNRTVLGKAIDTAKTFFWTYVIIAVLYTTVQVVNTVSSYQIEVKNVEAMVSPLAK